MYLRNRILPYFILVAAVTVEGDSNSFNSLMSPSSAISKETILLKSSLPTLLATSSSSTENATPEETMTPSIAGGSTVSSTISTPGMTNSTVNSTLNITSSTPSNTSGSSPGNVSARTTPATSSSDHSTGPIAIIISTMSTEVMATSTVNSTLNIASSTPSTTSGSSPGITSTQATPATSSSDHSAVSMRTSSSVGASSTTTTLESSTVTVMTSMSSTPTPTDPGDTLVGAIAGAGGAIILMIVIFIVIMSLVLIYVVMKTPKKKDDDSKWITGKELVDLNQLENDEENGRMDAGGTGGEAKVESNMEGEKPSEDKEAQENETTKVETNGEGDKKQEEVTTDKVEGSSSQPKEANSDEQPKTDTLVTANQSEKDKCVPSNIGDPTASTTGTDSSTPAKASTFVGGPSQTDGETGNKKLEDLLSGESSNQEKKTDASEDGSKEPPVTSPTPVVAGDQPKDITPNVSGTPEGDKGHKLQG